MSTVPPKSQFTAIPLASTSAPNAMSEVQNLATPPDKVNTGKKRKAPPTPEAFFGRDLILEKRRKCQIYVEKELRERLRCSILSTLAEFDAWGQQVLLDFSCLLTPNTPFDENAKILKRLRNEVLEDVLREGIPKSDKHHQNQGKEFKIKK